MKKKSTLLCEDRHESGRRSMQGGRIKLLYTKARCRKCAARGAKTTNRPFKMGQMRFSGPSGVPRHGPPRGPRTLLWGNPHAPPDVHSAHWRCELVSLLLLLLASSHCSSASVRLGTEAKRRAESAALKHSVLMLHRTLVAGFFLFFSPFAVREGKRDDCMGVK